jgi:hypothetical protein
LFQIFFVVVSFEIFVIHVLPLRQDHVSQPYRIVVKIIVFAF